MPITHAEMAGHLLGADPRYAAASFRTVFSDGEVGETGSLLYVARDRWIIDSDHGGRTVHTPQATTHEEADGTAHTIPGPNSPSHTSPLALLLPRYGAIHGRPGDDWIIDDREEIRTDPGSGCLRVTFKRIEGARYTVTALVHPTAYCITSFIAPVGTAELQNLRFELTESETALARALLGII